MKPLTRALVIINLILVLAYTIYYVRSKEAILAEGELLLFELAPLDPRSLIQGDYMVLDYAVSRGIDRDSVPKTGFLVVTKNAEGIAVRQRIQAKTTPLNSGEFLVNYKIPSWSMEIGAESYFFEEGTGATYEAAKYGGLKVDDTGNSLLVGLYDENRELLSGK